MPRIVFITHTDPAIDTAIPPQQWQLSEQGGIRIAGFAENPALRNVTNYITSAEPKAVAGGKILSEMTHKTVKAVLELGEVDRTESGYLSQEEFQKALDDFFNKPDLSAKEWETAAAAQQRIVHAVLGLALDFSQEKVIALVSHGTVGALLLAHIKGEKATRAHMQPTHEGRVGGHFFEFDIKALPSEKWNLRSEWAAIDPS